MRRWRTDLLLLVCFGGDLANGQSDADCISQGVAELAAQRFEQALKKFDAAARAAPQDAEAVFFQGVVLNRLGRHAAALERLKRATAMGAAHPDLAFETGWSLVGLRRWPEASYGLAVADYYFPAPSVQDRDGFAHTAAIQQHFMPRGTSLRARVAYFHGWSRAEGADFDSESDGFLVGVSHPLWWKISAEATYSRAWDRADHRNSQADSSGNSVRRRTESDSVGAQLRRPITPWLGVYAGYGFNRADANISFYKFHQHTGSAGVVVKF